MKIILPVQLNPISRRKDKSIKLSFETRELVPNEVLTLMSLEGAELWLALSNDDSSPEIPEDVGTPDVGDKSPSERLRNVLYVWYKQEVEKQRYVGLFDTFKKDKMEKLIDVVKSKLE